MLASTILRFAFGAKSQRELTDTYPYDLHFIEIINKTLIFVYLSILPLK